MKKVYIDANIFIDFLDEQRATDGINLHEKAVSLFKNLISKNIKIITSEDIITTAVYALRQNKKALKILADFLSEIKNLSDFAVVPFGYETITNAAEFYIMNGGDFEDILQYFCAMQNDCRVFYSNDKNFPEIDIRVKRTNPNLNDFSPKNA